MPRFFVPAAALQDTQALLTGEQAAHCKVLRLSAGDTVTLCDGCGHEAEGTILQSAPGQVTVSLGKTEPSRSEPRLICRIYMGFPKADKLEHVIQKATELGAAQIVVFPCARSVSRPDEKAIAGKLERWRKIACAAAEQSGRGCIPQVLALPSFAEAVRHAANAELSILFYENEQVRSLRQAVEQRPFRSAAILTGPEGGLTEEEVKLAQDAGMTVCSLGPRILRCETAPLCALSAILYAADELNP